MPIKTENKSKYPENWAELRASVMERAGARCEVCGIPNYAIVEKKTRRIILRHEVMATGVHTPEKLTGAQQYLLQRLHWSRIVLTIAHLDHDPTNNDLSNLKAMCQLDHNRYDRQHRDETIAAAKHKAMSKNYEGWQLRLPLPIKDEEILPHFGSPPIQIADIVAGMPKDPTKEEENAPEE